MTFARELPRTSSDRRWHFVLGAIAALAVGALVVWAASATVHHASSMIQKIRSTASAVAGQPAPECVQDDDCVLRPSLVTCCGTCPATRPYEALPVLRLEQLLREADDACGPSLRFCDPPACPSLELDVDVHAVCTAGACRVVESPPVTWIAGQHPTPRQATP